MMITRDGPSPSATDPTPHHTNHPTGLAVCRFNRKEQFSVQHVGHAVHDSTRYCVRHSLTYIKSTDRSCRW
jgi:hypothetical protein